MKRRACLQTCFVFLLAWLHSCSNALPDHCEDLSLHTTKERVSEALAGWVDAEIREHKINDGDISRRGVFIPADYVINNLDFDWDTLGLNSSQKRIGLVGAERVPRSYSAERIVSESKSVFFSDRSRIGVLVKMEGAEDYGIGSDEEFLSIVSERVAVLCFQ